MSAVEPPRRGRPRRRQEPPPDIVPDMPLDERRRSLRRLDDLLEALEVLNLADSRRVPEQVADRLRELGIEEPHQQSIARLIELVWKAQEPYLVKLAIDRRTRTRRRTKPEIESWLHNTA